MNFPLILVLFTLATGLYWLIDSLFFAKRREGDEPILVEYARSFFPVLFIVLALRSFLFEPFRIPSESMLPTLIVGDFILVNKFSYGVRLPVIHTKILDTGAPERGDVAVFRFPENPKIDFIKRVVGVPGDVVSMRGKSLMINGEVLENSDIGPYVLPGTDDKVDGMSRQSEKLGGIVHDILVTASKAVPEGSESSIRSQVEQSWEIVPDGHYFMMGDNRDRSNDSRFWGFVPEENLVGKAKYIWMHWNGGILWSRLGDKIQ